MNLYLNSNIEIHKFDNPSLNLLVSLNLNSNIEIHKLDIQL